MDYKPLVSVIIPVFNAERYLEQTILSVLNQSWNHFEIIIVDDGSQDASLQIVEKYQNRQVRLLKQENKGAATARNNGFKESKGEFIQFMDSDDLLSENKIELQVKSLLNSGLKLAVCDMIYFDDGVDPFQSTNPPLENRCLYTTNDPVEFLINLWGGNGGGSSLIQTNSWLIPRSLIAKAGIWSEFYSPDDDGEFFSRCILNSEGIIYTKGCYNYYRKFTNAASLSNRKTFKALEGCFRSVLLKRDNLFSHTTDARAKQVIAEQLLDIAIKAYPQFKQLSDDVLAEVEKLGNFSYQPPLGGKTINAISHVLGWKTARRLQYLINK